MPGYRAVCEPPPRDAVRTATGVLLILRLCRSCGVSDARVWIHARGPLTALWA